MAGAERTDPGAIFVVPLSPPKPWLSRAGLYLFALALVAGGVWLGVERLGPLWFDGSRAWGVGLGLLFAAVLLAWLGPRARPPAELPPVELGPEHLRLPRSVLRRRTDRVPLLAVSGIGFVGGERGSFEVQTRFRRYRYPVAQVSEPERFAELGRRYAERVAELDGGREHLAHMARRAELGATLVRRTPVVTRGLLALMLLGHVLQLLVGGDAENPYVRLQSDLRMGGNAGALVADEPWRLVTATFLHGNLTHLYLNGIALLALGGGMERLVGSGRFFTLFFASAGVGAALSAGLSPAALSLGASGGIFGALGGFAALHLVRHRSLPTSFRQSSRWWAVITLLNLGLPLLVPVIDVWAHFGGALTGLVLGLGFALTPGFRLGASAGRPTRVAVAAVGVVVGASLLAGAVHASRPAEGHRADLARVLLGPAGAGAVTPERLERAVAVLARDDAPDHLRSAADAWLQEAAETEHASAPVLLARSERLEAAGALASAIALRWQTYVDRGAFGFAALVDGLARLKTRPLVLLSAAPPEAELRWSAAAETMTLRLGGPVEAPSSAFFLVRGADDRALGVLEWPVRPERSPGGTAPLEAPLLDHLESGASLELALWAAPARAEAPRFLTLDPVARRAWRRFPAP